MIVKLISFCLFLSVASAFRPLWSPMQESVFNEFHTYNQVCSCRPLEGTKPVSPVAPNVYFNQYTSKNSPYSPHITRFIKYLDELTKTPTCLDAYIVNELIGEALLHVKHTQNNLDLILAVIQNNRKKLNPDSWVVDPNQSQTQDTDEDTTSSQESAPSSPDQPIIFILNNFILHNNAQDRGSVEYILKLLKQNEYKLHPKTYELLVILLNTQKNGPINKINDILLLLLNNDPEIFSNKLTRIIVWLLQTNNNIAQNPNLGNVILYLLEANKDNNFDDNQLDVLMYILQPDEDGIPNSEVLDALMAILHNYKTDPLDKETLDLVLLALKYRYFTNLDVYELNIFDILHGIELLSPNEAHALLRILTSATQFGSESNTVIEIVLKLLAKVQYVTSDNLKQILLFLLSHPNGDLDVPLILVEGLFIDVPLTQNLLSMLQRNRNLLKSIFFGTIIDLYNNDLLDHQLLSVLIELLSQESMGTVNQNQIQILIELLERYKQYNAAIVTEIINRIKYASSNYHKYPDKPPYNSNDQNLQPPDVVPTNYGNIIQQLLLWQSNGGLQNHAMISDEVIQYLMELVDVNDAGVVELTYLLKNQKPFVYNPLYYVKYRISLPAFISNVKYLFAKNPQLASNPVELFKELVSFGNMTEISPGLTAYPQEEIVKQTHKEGSLIQAKVLDYNAMNENDQISLVHQLSTDNVSPADLLQLNELKGLNFGMNTVDLKQYISSNNPKLSPSNFKGLSIEEGTYPQTDTVSNQYSKQQGIANSKYSVFQNAHVIPVPYQIQNNYMDFDFHGRKRED